MPTPTKEVTGATAAPDYFIVRHNAFTAALNALPGPEGLLRKIVHGTFAAENSIYMGEGRMMPSPYSYDANGFTVIEKGEDTIKLTKATALSLRSTVNEMVGALMAEPQFTIKDHDWNELRERFNQDLQAIEINGEVHTKHHTRIGNSVFDAMEAAAEAVIDRAKSGVVTLEAFDEHER